MVDLTDLLTWQAPQEIPPSSSPKTFHVYNANWWSVTNGGCCIAWTVPTGTSQIKFELVGGGGPGGSSGGDHDGGIGGQGGAYAVSTLNSTAGGGGWYSNPTVCISGGGGSSAAATAVVDLSTGKIGAITVTNGGSSYTSQPDVCFVGTQAQGSPDPHFIGNNGQGGRVCSTISGGVITAMTVMPDFCSTAGNESVYTICAAGTSECSCCCSCTRNCKHGCHSYVTGDGLYNFCAMGGEGGPTQYDIHSNCYNCFINSAQCSLGGYNGPWYQYQNMPGFCGADYGLPGSPGGMYKDYDCCQSQFSWAGSPRGPFSSGGLDGMNNAFCNTGISCCQAHSSFPGGGGGGRQIGASTGCVAQWGNSGLVKVTYQ